MSATSLFGRAAADARSHGPVVQLQALRGIAAAIVVVYHGALYFDYGAGGRAWMTLVFNAHAAVVSFFVLSGFVLALSLMRAPLDARQVGLFYVRRGFRIYPALWAACALGIAYLVLFDTGGTALGTEWSRINFGGWPVEPGRLMLALAGLKPNLPLPIWSMAIEVVGSLAMPFMILAMRRSTWLFGAMTALLAIVALVAPPRPMLMPTYLVDFALGAAVALFAPQLRRLLADTRRAAVMMVAGGAILWFGRLVTGADYEAGYHDPLTSLIEAAGAAMLIGAIYVRPMLLRPLSAPAAIRLGDHSYSLYLLHQPVLGIVTAIGAILVPGAIVASPGLATVAAIGLTLVITLPLARLGFHHVELPAIRLGARAVAAIAALRARRHDPVERGLFASQR